MNVREFDGVDDYIRMGLGTAAIAVQSFALLYRPMTDNNRMHYNDGAGTVQTAAFQFPTGEWRVNYGAVASDSSFGPLTAADWAIMVVRKSTGTVLPRFSRYDFDTNVWTHGDGTASVANAGTSTVGYEFGRSSGGANYSHMRVVASAIWSGNPFANDAAVETLKDNLQTWKNFNPSSLWGFDQASTATAVVDLASNAAGQSAIVGTAVVADAAITFDMTLSSGNPWHAYAHMQHPGVQ